MANMFDWNALDQKINATVAEYDELGKSKALTVVAVSEIMEIDIDEAVDAITDGGNDRGVDALYIDDRDAKNDIHVFQAKCVNDFEKSKNNFPGDEIDKLISFVTDLTNHDAEALESANDLLKAKILDALEVLKESNATITVHFIGNTAPLIDSELKRIRTVFSRYKAIEFRMHDLDTLSDFFLEKRAPELVREITAIDTNFFDRTDQNLRGVVCSVAAMDIVDAIRSEEDPDQVEAGIFDQNVRVYLKRRNRINRRIIESALSDDNHMFWYQNNGITMTCDKVDLGPSRRSPKIKLTNVQIVNGGQTSNCLFEAAKEQKEKVEDVILLVRIIETSSEDVKMSIAETTNSQTPINVRDLRSNDRQQRQLEEAFADLGYYYERKSGQHADKDSSRRVDALSSGQAYLAYGIGLPETAKKDRGRVFGDLYDTVFAEDLTANKLLTSFKLIRLVNDQKKEVRKKIREGANLEAGKMSLIDGSFHVLFAIRQICNRDEIDTWDYDLAKDNLNEAVTVVSKLYAESQSSDANFSSNRYFKDARTKDQVTKTVG
ncbi:AIPR family protein [Roseovarius sp. D0-M9]|uniref:AIPR family protein n=1 Tax=Roseovarius sp. D0-M9 TaxID=3127117 RepID=UPI0030101741